MKESFEFVVCIVPLSGDELEYPDGSNAPTCRLQGFLSAGRRLSSRPCLCYFDQFRTEDNKRCISSTPDLVTKETGR
ncbi:hypothetical protein CBR_g34344 [Chara braunii]|uniref:Uncharacterized protein n=1 Tax=Chara braunii TaxID=69332 RepID=A0A388LIA3_CHABU|nr:hypothetical protein CBR_g34344 [Chara braunii]|eukprot:GBG82064.1 hypothetical protein CBR_g34344 [Chara braunii]